ncbi:hypothetical protein [Bacillus sp. SRB_8]|nr:hypothetical protein [Bacillus sp. SRB_8]
MSSLSYTDLQLQAFFAQDTLAKGIYEMDTKITNAEKEIATPVWKRVGGATIDLWERWYNK